MTVLLQGMSGELSVSEGRVSLSEGEDSTEGALVEGLGRLVSDFFSVSDLSSVSEIKGVSGEGDVSGSASVGATAVVSTEAVVSFSASEVAKGASAPEQETKESEEIVIIMHSNSEVSFDRLFFIKVTAFLWNIYRFERIITSLAKEKLKIAIRPQIFPTVTFYHTL